MKELSIDASAIKKREDDVCELTRLGKSIENIAYYVGLSKSQVVRIRMKYGLTSFKVERFSDEEIKIILNFLEDGCSYNEVARTVGRHVGSIARKFPGYGWTLEEQIEYVQVRKQYKLTPDLGNYKR